MEQHTACLSRAEPVLDPDAPYNIACFESIAGHTDLALEHLAQAIKARGAAKREALHDPDLAWIRDHARFSEIVDPLPDDVRFDLNPVTEGDT